MAVLILSCISLTCETFRIFSSLLSLCIDLRIYKNNAILEDASEFMCDKDRSIRLSQNGSNSNENNLQKT